MSSRIEALRRAKGLSLRQLAEWSGLSEERLRRIEDGDILPGDVLLPDAVAIASALDVSVETVLGLDSGPGSIATNIRIREILIELYQLLGIAGREQLPKAYDWLASSIPTQMISSSLRLDLYVMAGEGMPYELCMRTHDVNIPLGSFADRDALRGYLMDIERPYDLAWRGVTK